MIDIHTHMIFDVDDGSASLEETVEMLKSAQYNGVTEVIFTPHYVDCGEYDKRKVEENFESIKKVIIDNDIHIKVYLGNEVVVYGNIREILKDKNVATLANSKYMLIEFPINIDVSYVEDTICEMKTKGLVPIIAHPERCECFIVSYSRIKKAVDDGALLQCNTGSFIGIYGKISKNIVKKLLKDDLISFIATDSHKIRHNRYTDIEMVQEEVRKIVGRYKKNKLFTYNARAILINNDISRD